MRKTIAIITATLALMLLLALTVAALAAEPVKGHDTFATCKASCLAPGNIEAKTFRIEFEQYPSSEEALIEMGTARMLVNVGLEAHKIFPTCQRMTIEIAGADGTTGTITDVGSPLRGGK